MDELLVDELMKNGITELSTVCALIGAKREDLNWIIEQTEFSSKAGYDVPDGLVAMVPKIIDGKEFVGLMAVFGFTAILDEQLGYPFHQEILDANKEAFKKELNL